jgi:hypothetical protein
MIQKQLDALVKSEAVRIAAVRLIQAAMNIEGCSSKRRRTHGDWLRLRSNIVSYFREIELAIS